MKTTIENPVNKPIAENLKYYQLTEDYTPSEFWMLKKAAKQLGDIPHVFVGSGSGSVSLWRSRNRTI